MYISGILQISFTVMFFEFPSKNVCLLHKGYGVVFAASHVISLEKSKHNAFDLIDEIFGNFNSILNIFPDPHDFLIFPDSVTIYISLRSNQPTFLHKKHWRTFSWSGKRACRNNWNEIWSTYQILLGILLCEFLLPERHLLFTM